MDPHIDVRIILDGGHAPVRLLGELAFVISARAL